MNAFALTPVELARLRNRGLIAFPMSEADEARRSAQSKYVRVYRMMNYERLAARRKELYWANPHRYRAKARATYHRNRATILPKQRAYQKRNRQQLLAAKRAHYQENREVYLAKAARARAKARSISSMPSLKSHAA